MQPTRTIPARASRSRVPSNALQSSHLDTKEEIQLARVERPIDKASADMPVLRAHHKRLHRTPLDLCGAHGVLKSCWIVVGVDEIDTTADTRENDRIRLKVELQPPGLVVDGRTQRADRRVRRRTAEIL